MTTDQIKAKKTFIVVLTRMSDLFGFSTKQVGQSLKLQVQAPPLSMMSSIRNITHQLFSETLY